MTIKRFKIHLDSLKIAAGVGLFLCLALGTILTVFWYYSQFYSWLYRNYSNVIANISFFIMVFLVVTIVTYIKIRKEENE